MELAVPLHFLGNAILAGCAAYATLSALAVMVRRARSGPPISAPCPARSLAPVSVLKPLYGDEPRLYENLRSFCIQSYPDYQLLFGVRDAGDPALIVVQRLLAEFPGRDIEVVVDPSVHGINLKVSNLINLLRHARHDLLVLADSDIAVGPDYLARVTIPLAQADVGVVTCLYRGRATGGIWSRLGVQFIDDWFLPSIRLARFFGSTAYAFGSTLALRRSVLASIGGLESLSGEIADDYWLGKLTRDRGLRTVLSDYEVVTDVVETRFGDLAARELRWLRTIRSVRPLSYLFTGVCFTLPMVVAGLALSGGSGGMIAESLAIAAIVARLLLYLDSQAQGADAGGALNLIKNFLLFLLRDSLSLLLWACGLLGDKVHWRGQQMKIDAGAPVRASTERFANT